MCIKIRLQHKYLILLLIVVSLFGSIGAQAGQRFSSSYHCSDAVKKCISSGTRIVDGFSVHRDCWEYAYVKSCNYPSKNDCRLWEHCYAVGDKGCLLRDNYGNCVNMQKEFSCKSWEHINLENETTRTDLVEKEGPEGLVCSGIPCIDGHCVDKSYETNGEMMDSLSKLYASSQMKPDGDHTFNLFQGHGQHCSKKAASYSNCCAVDPKGWGRKIGAKCTKDEQTLMEERSKNLCVYVGAKKKKTAGVTLMVKHQYCCFGNILDKVIQVEGRKQLGRGFGSPDSPDCRGLTLEEIKLIDFSKVDFSEFINELKVKFAKNYKSPNAEDLSATIEDSFDDIRRYDGDDSNPENNHAGWNSSWPDSAYEDQSEVTDNVEESEG